MPAFTFFKNANRSKRSSIDGRSPWGLRSSLDAPRPSFSTQNSGESYVVTLPSLQPAPLPQTMFAGPEYMAQGPAEMLEEDNMAWGASRPKSRRR